MEGRLPRREALLLLLLLAAAAAANDEGTCPSRHRAPSAEERRARHARECSHLVHDYMANHTADFEAAHDVRKLVFFLHVPRTGAGAAGGWRAGGV